RRTLYRAPCALLALLRPALSDPDGLALRTAQVPSPGRGREDCLMGLALFFHGPGTPLEPVRFAAPQPRGAELVVRVSYCTLCRSDLHTYAGRRSQPTPTVLGHEIVGRIETFGPEAARHDARGTAVNVGDRVSWALAVGCGQCFFCAEDLP